MIMGGPCKACRFEIGFCSPHEHMLVTHVLCMGSLFIYLLVPAGTLAHLLLTSLDEGTSNEDAPNLIAFTNVA